MAADELASVCHWNQYRLIFTEIVFTYCVRVAFDSCRQLLCDIQPRAPFNPVVLNHFAEETETQTCDFVREPLKTILNQVNRQVLFYYRTKSIAHNIRGFIERLLRAAQKVLGSRIRPRKEPLT